MVYCKNVNAWPLGAGNKDKGETVLARACAVCGKKVAFGHRVSHSNKKTLRRWEPNLHRVRAMVKGREERLKVCSRCLKSGKVTRAL